MKKLLLTICAVALVLTLFACTAAPAPVPSPTPTPTASSTEPVKVKTPPTPEITLEPTPTPTEIPAPTPESTPEPLPATRDIPVSREGESEIFVGNLNISRRGYAIYLIDDFILIEGNEYDTVCPSSETEISSEIYMHIFEPDSELEKSEIIDIGGGALYVRYFFPLEAAEGGAVLLQAMANTICAAH